MSGTITNKKIPNSQEKQQIDNYILITISVLSWNIAGWVPKQADSDFLRFLSKFDFFFVLFFAGDMDIGEFSIPSYFSLLAPVQHSLSGGGSKGGLGLFIAFNVCVQTAKQSARFGNSISALLFFAKGC